MQVLRTHTCAAWCAWLGFFGSCRRAVRDMRRGVVCYDVILLLATTRQACVCGVHAHSTCQRLQCKHIVGRHKQRAHCTPTARHPTHTCVVGRQAGMLGEIAWV